MDVLASPEQQLEKMSPKIEGATEANAKLTGAKDASSGTTAIESSSENEKLKLATADKAAGATAETRLTRASDQSDYHDSAFKDTKGHSIALRTWHSGDLVQVRAYDQTIQQPKDTPDIGQAGYANLTLERNVSDDSVSRARLNDIETYHNYRGGGLGDEMLRTCEQTAKQNGAQEIYGAFSPRGDADKVQAFYQRNGYGFRPSAMGGEEIFKKLS